MEPNDLLDVSGEPPPGPDELRAIAARAGKYRWRVVAAGAAVALVAGGGIGYAVSDHGTHPAQTVVASGGTPGSQTSGGAAAAQPAIGAPDTSPEVGEAVPSSEFAAKYKKLFTRTVGDTDIRAFTVTFASPLYSSSCVQAAPQSSIVVEASNPAAVGTVNASPDSSPLTGSDFSATGEAFGVQEGEPIEIVIVHSASGVSKVTADVPAGKVVDEMAPVGGWSALAVPIPSSVAGAKVDSSFGTIELLTSAGKVITTSPVTFGDWGTSAGSTSNVVPPAVGSGSASSSSASSSGAVSGSTGSTGSQVATPAYPCTCPDNTPSTGTHVLVPSCACPATALCACPAIARSNTAVHATCATSPPVSIPAPPASGESGSLGGGSGNGGASSTSVSGTTAGGSPPGIPPSNVSSGSSATTAGG